VSELSHILQSIRRGHQYLLVEAPSGCVVVDADRLAVVVFEVDAEHEAAVSALREAGVQTLGWRELPLWPGFAGSRGRPEEGASRDGALPVLQVAEITGQRASGVGAWVAT
jgi:hypothetical protein